MSKRRASRCNNLRRMTRHVRCWCGETRLEPFGGGYRACPACESLVRIEWPPGDLIRVRDEQNDLYGREYWFSHQRQLGLPSVAARSVDDLGERCLTWLRTLLRFRAPAGRSLEIGAAHGGFVAMLEGVGFEAAGVELSAEICAFARRAFGVTMHTGPIEDLDLEPGFDAVIAMDVLEHLPDPCSTFDRAVSWLADDGVVLVQTPCRPVGPAGEALSFESLREREHRFLEMLIPEHLFLFSTRAAEMFCQRLGLRTVRFETPHVPDYDMCFLASRGPLERRDPPAIRDDLTARSGARMIAALLDVDRDRRELGSQLEAARSDQRVKQALIDRDAELLTSLRDDQAAKEALIERLSEEISALREDQSAKAALIEKISDELAAVRADQAAKEALIQRMAREASAREAGT